MPATMLVRAAVIVEEANLLELIMRQLDELPVVCAPMSAARFGTAEALGLDLLLTTAALAPQLRTVVAQVDDGPEILVVGDAPLADAIALHRERLLHQRDALPPELPRLRDFVSESEVMSGFMKTVHRVVGADASLLILGETGVGKERLAHAIHAAGPRKQGPFLAVNCGALPETLLESELFGHAKGAFTGAVRTRKGHFELAEGGTIFLDEIGEMPSHLQSRLLRVLQERTLQPVGSENVRKIDVRVMAATNRNLDEEISSGRFRADLFYRLGVVTLTIPPLRERREDIPELARRYLHTTARKLGRTAPELPESTVAALTRYDWPGNVRELVNAMERSLLLCDGDRIQVQDLPTAFGHRLEQALAPNAAEDALPERYLAMPWKAVREEVLHTVERRYLSRLLEETGGRVGEAAKRAGMSERALFSKMRRFGLRKEDFRR